MREIKNIHFDRVNQLLSLKSLKSQAEFFISLDNGSRTCATNVQQIIKTY
jgi:hypothetical protein